MKYKIFLLIILGIVFFFRSPVLVFAGISCTDSSQCSQPGACSFNSCTAVLGEGISGSCSWSSSPYCTCSGGTCTSWCTGSFRCTGEWTEGGCNGAPNCQESTARCDDCGNSAFTCHRHPSHNVCQGCACITVPGLGTQECADGSSCACTTPTPTATRVPSPTPTTTSRLTPTSTPTPTPIPCDAPCDGFSDRRCAIGLTCQPYGVAFLCKNPGCPIERQTNCRCLNLTPTPTPTTILARCMRLVPDRPLTAVRIGEEVVFAVGYTDLGLVEDIAFRVFKDGQILETRFQSTNPAGFSRFRFTNSGRYAFAAYVKSMGVWR